MRGQVLNWLRAFLSGRRQRVVLGSSTSEWCEVLSGVPQGSVLGPLLFVVFINDLPEIIQSTCKLFADDCKIMATVNEPDDCSRFQRDIDAVFGWCNEWSMELNVNKCRVMHCGRRNPSYVYSFKDDDTPLQVTMRERDLGIIITPDMKWHDQVMSASSKASQMLGALKKSFRTRDESVWKKLISTYIRPQVEFAVPVWNPYQRGDIRVVERVMRRASKVPGNLRNLDYSERCERLGFSDLETRSRRGDLIQQFKIAKNIDQVEFVSPIQTSAPRSGKRAQMRRELVRGCGQRHNFFINRVVNNWNELDESIIEAQSVNEFKNRLDNSTGGRRKRATIQGVVTHRG